MPPSHATPRTPTRPQQRQRRSQRYVASGALAALALAVAACGGDDGGVAVDTAAAVTTAAPAVTDATTVTTVATVAETTTTAAPATSTSEVATTTTVPGPPVYPLTGVVVSDPFIAGRPTLVVKIDNAPAARPQSGMNAADIVIEEIVNDNLTRFAMVFHSQDADPVGPIRSGRLQDVDLFGSFNRPLFAWSGGNRTVTDAVRASDLVDIGPQRANVYYRSSDRRAPHNLYSSTAALRTATPEGSLPPAQQFSYRSEGEAPQGVPSPGVALALDAVDVRWTWDEASGLYLREMEGQPHQDRNSGQVSTNNVVVLEMEYVPGISDSPDAQTIGSGRAMIFTAGRFIEATWSRENRLQPFVLTQADGTLVELTPGRTFIELPRTDKTIPLPAA